MRIISITLIIFLLASCSNTKKVNSETVGSVDIDKSLGALCGADLQTGLLAVKMREQGETRDFLQLAVDAMPVSQVRKKRIMNSSLHDAYENPELPKEIYGMYRMEACYQQVIGKNIPEFLTKEMVVHLVKCSKIVDQNPQFLCASAVAKKYAK